MRQLEAVFEDGLLRLGLSFESVVHFFADERLNRNLLGGNGWLDRIGLGLIHHTSRIYLARRD